MKSTFVLVAGMLLLVLGAQGAIRLLVDHGNAGWLSWVPGGFGIWLTVDLIAVVVGGVLASWGSQKVKQAKAEAGE